MKSKTKKLTLALILFSLIVRAQNLISNNGFETYSACPTGLAEIYKCTGWFNVIIDGDYNNCSYNTNAYYPSPTGAYAGTGYIDFATYGDANGSAESMGHLLNNPLVLNHNYQFSVYAKKASGGNWSQVCGGVCLYGFMTDPSWQSTSGMCTGALAGAVLLGCTDTVSDINWLPYSFQFSSPNAFPFITVTPYCAPTCTEAIFVDELVLQDLTVGFSSLSTDNKDIRVSYSEETGNIKVKINEVNFNTIKNPEFMVYDITGKKIIKMTLTSHETFISYHASLTGLYFYQLTGNNKIISDGKFYIHQ